jgi:hypothetical protein
MRLSRSWTVGGIHQSLQIASMASCREILYQTTGSHQALSENMNHRVYRADLISRGGRCGGCVCKHVALDADCYLPAVSLNA